MEPSFHVQSQSAIRFDRGDSFQDEYGCLCRGDGRLTERADDEIVQEIL